MLGTIGDLVEDVLVHLSAPLAGGPINIGMNIGSDTTVVVRRRRGGSAANVAAAAVRVGGSARFIGQVGADQLGDTLVAALQAEGVDVVVRRGGRSGTVVALVEPGGERTMLADRAACRDLRGADPAWLDGLDTLHVPVYSLTDGSLGETATALVHLAHDRSVRVSIDASSVSVMEAYGLARLVEMLDRLRPDVLLCNADEARCFGDALWDGSVGAATVVVKRGPDPAIVVERGGARREVAAPPVGPVSDTTGAGDAFAAGFLVALAGGDDVDAAARAGHRAAAGAIARASLGYGTTADPDDVMP